MVKKKRKKASLKARKANPDSSYWKGKADDAWSEEIKKVGECEVCGRTSDQCQLSAHHIIGRTRLRYRHDLSNGLCLCQTHHTLGSYEDVCAHGDMRQAENFKAWFKDTCPGQFQWFEEHKDDKRQKEMTYKECYESLTKG